MKNSEISSTLRKIAVVYQILGENRFKIIAYERAAELIDHLPKQLDDMWKTGVLKEESGLGKTILSHIVELFKTGRSTHFDTVLKNVPESIFLFLEIPGLGPKKAYRLIKEFGLDDPQTAIDGLRKAANEGKIAGMDGFGEKSQADILAGIALYEKGAIKEKRILLSQATETATSLCDYLRHHQHVERVEILGSLRRQTATVGDIDLAVVTNKPEQVLDYFLQYPHDQIIERGPTGASMVLVNGRQVDVRVVDAAIFGSMVQYFTGSKAHNVALRTYALSIGLSLNEYGIKHVSSGTVTKYPQEEDFYSAMNLQWIPPELREDQGEISSAKSHTLPFLIEPTDIKGDLHIHTNYDLHSSHDLGTNPIEDYLTKAENLHYEFIGLSDHNPSVSTLSENQIIQVMKDRKTFYEHHYYSYKLKTKCRVQIVLMCEVDILADGSLALPPGAFDFVDGIIVSIHSSFNSDKDLMTKRIVKALTNHPKVRVFGHPTGRLLGKREGYELNWDTIFTVCKERDIAIEINASPMRLDLPDFLVLEAVKRKVKLSINSDSHDIDHMDVMPYGVSVARRGWASKHDIVNTLRYNDFITWFGRHT